MAGWQQGLDSRLLQRLQQPLNRKNIGQVLVDRTDRFLTRFSLVEQQFERWGKFQESNPSDLPIVFAKPTLPLNDPDPDLAPSLRPVDNGISKVRGNENGAIAPSASPVLHPSNHSKTVGSPSSFVPPLSTRNSVSLHSLNSGAVASSSDILIQRFVEPTPTATTVGLPATNPSSEVVALGSNLTTESRPNSQDFFANNVVISGESLTTNLDFVQGNELSLVNLNPAVSNASQAKVSQAKISKEKVSVSFGDLSRESNGTIATPFSQAHYDPISSSNSPISSSHQIIVETVITGRSPQNFAQDFTQNSIPNADVNDVTILADNSTVHFNSVQKNHLPLVDLNSPVYQPSANTSSTEKVSISSENLNHVSTKAISTSSLPAHHVPINSPTALSDFSNILVTETEATGRSPQSFANKLSQNDDANNVTILGESLTTLTKKLYPSREHNLPLIDFNPSVSKTSNTNTSNTKVAVSSGTLSHASPEVSTTPASPINYDSISSPSPSVRPSHAVMIETIIAGRSPQSLARNLAKKSPHNLDLTFVIPEAKEQNYKNKIVNSITQMVSSIEDAELFFNQPLDTLSRENQDSDHSTIQPINNLINKSQSELTSTNPTAISVNRTSLPIQDSDLPLLKTPESLTQKVLIQRKQNGDRSTIQPINNLINKSQSELTSTNPTAISVNRTSLPIQDSDLPLPKAPESLTQKVLIQRKQNGDRSTIQPINNLINKSQFELTSTNPTAISVNRTSLPIQDSDLLLLKTPESLTQKVLIQRKQNGDRSTIQPINNLINKSQSELTSTNPTAISVNRTSLPIQDSDLLLPKAPESLTQKVLIQRKQNGDRPTITPKNSQSNITSSNKPTVMKGEKIIDTTRFTDVPLVSALPNIFEQTETPLEKQRQASPKVTVLPVVKTRLEQLLSRQRKPSQLQTVAPQNLVKRSPHNSHTPLVKPLPQPGITNSEPLERPKPTSVQPQTAENPTQDSQANLPLTQTKIIQTERRSPTPPNPTNPFAAATQTQNPVPIVSPQLREAAQPITETFQAAMAAATQQPPVDIQAIATQVEKKLRRKLVIERERRGQGRWR